MAMMPQTILNYRIERPLASGGMGTVYLAHSALGEPVAIKRLHEQYRAQPTIRQRFRRDAETLYKLRHQPNIVRVINIDEAEDAIVMEYIAGETLAERLDTDPGAYTDPAVALALMKPLLAAFGKIHAAQVIHRDIKPANLMIRQADGAPVILDFGIAKDETATLGLSEVGTRLGSLAYMSPEQLRSTQGLTHRTDIYALGATLYHLLTGRIPFRRAGASDLELMQQIDREPFPRASAYNPRVTPALQAILDRATARDPERRYPSCEAFAEALEDWRATSEAPPVPPVYEGVTLIQEGASVPPPEPKSGTEPAPVPRRSRTGLIAAAIGVLVLGGTLWVSWNPVQEFRARQAVAEQDYAQAVGILKPLAEDGRAGAQVLLAQLYRQGRGVAPSTAEARRWLERAADAGEPTAKAALIPLLHPAHESGRMFALAQDAAKEGDPLGQLYLGAAYHYGRGTAPDAAQAYEWYRKAAEKGQPLAQCLVGDFHATGRGGVSADTAVAASWYRRAAAQQEPLGAYQLGLLAEQRRDSAGAVGWFRQAAEAGHAPAQNRLGLAYGTGRGVGEDQAAATGWFRKAAAQGYPDALYNLGYQYYFGKGVDRIDHSAGRTWLRRAADARHEGARKVLAQLNS
jgi:TPR repeat protein/tRNA A-37 threonylcarbamoyl transferase component Bud32